MLTYHHYSDPLICDCWNGNDVIFEYKPLIKIENIACEHMVKCCEITGINHTDVMQKYYDHMGFGIYYPPKF